ncbi:MAG: FAD binding domain-containing protein [Cyanobacteria bacterium SZAS LIN-2]|nr:FAD binding domain-containing protein [Cyanobacteria bacterium SZAS LIN-2]
MRDYILLYVNGREHRLRGAQAFAPISDFLRLDLALCGTKVVCAEGDCGACSVMLGRPQSATADRLTYVPVNSCIQFAYQLDRAHIVTVEGLKLGAALNPLQQSMVDCNGAQCGYCTPGFVVALCGAANQLCGKQKEVNKAGKACLSEKQVKDALTGNLCRCTGYEGIIKSGMDFDLNAFKSFSELYDEKPILESLRQHAKEPVTIEWEGRSVFLPADLESAVQFLGDNAGAKKKVTIVSGGTDVSVVINKRGLTPAVTMSLCNMAGLDDLSEKEVDGRRVLTVGARVTLAQLEHYFKDRVPQFHYVLWVYGSPQIRQAGTLAGNIGNGSPIADSLPFLFAMGADVEVTGPDGPRRIPIQSFYKGYKTLAMESAEMISRVFIPLPKSDEILRLYKISKRQHLDISSFTAAIVVRVKHDKIAYARVVLGGVGPVVLRLTEVEEFLQGKVNKLETFKGAGRMARKIIEPIDDVRGSREYRLQLAENIFQRFFYEMHESKEKALV